jgi:hypothetical protein
MINIGRAINKFANHTFGTYKRYTLMQSLSFYFACIFIINLAKTFPLPFLADSINEGTVANFLKKEGQWV